MHLIWLMLGVRARRSASRAMGLHASKREAPNARYISTLSLLSLYVENKPSNQCGVYCGTY